MKNSSGEMRGGGDAVACPEARASYGRALAIEARGQRAAAVSAARPGKGGSKRFDVAAASKALHGDQAAALVGTFLDTGRITPERAAKGGFEEINPARIDSKEMGSTLTLRAVDRSGIDWLFKRGLVTARQYEAAQHLERDRRRAGLALSLASVDLEGRTARLSACDDVAEAAIDAQARVNHAMGALSAAQASIVWNVVVMGEAIEAAMSRVDMSGLCGDGRVTRGMAAGLMLRLGLEVVADRYGVPRTK